MGSDPTPPCDCCTRAIVPYRAREIVPVTEPSCLCHRARADVPVPKTLSLSHRARATVPGPSCLCPSHRASACVFLLECQIHRHNSNAELETILSVGGCDAKSTKRKSTSEDRWLFNPSVCAFSVPPLDKPSMATQSHRKVQESDAALWRLGT